MQPGNILFSQDHDGVATLTVNRPEKRNALNAETIAELDSLLSSVASAGNVRGLILTGAGDRAFVAGADINELARVSPVEAYSLARRGQRVFRKLETLGIPSIAAINGFALGGGLELAMSCSMRVAAATARMGQPEILLGIVPGYGGTQRLPRLVGRGNALEMLLTGEAIDAERALRIGLINHVVAPDQLLAFSRSILGKILANAPVAARLILQAVDTGLDSGLEAGLEFEAAAFGLSAATADRVEGTQAFLEKRTAKFLGK